MIISLKIINWKGILKKLIFGKFINLSCMKIFNITIVVCESDNNNSDFKAYAVLLQNLYQMIIF